MSELRASRSVIERITVQLSEEKPIGAVKLNEDYRGYCLTEAELHFTVEVYKNPLMAANAARKLEKLLRKTEKKKITKKAPTVTKVRPKRLFTEAELAELSDSSMRLRFRERWVIVSPHKMYVCEPSGKKEIVSLSDDRCKAKVFNTYEAAMIELKVLDSVLRRGHTVMRFWEDTQITS